METYLGQSYHNESEHLFAEYEEIVAVEDKNTMSQARLDEVNSIALKACKFLSLARRTQIPGPTL